SRVKEYLPITGLADFNKCSAKLIFGADSPAIQENRVTTVQCLSGTGSLRVGAEFLAKHYHQRTIYIPRPTWGNHPKVFSIAGLAVEYYRYYEPNTRGLDFQGLLEDLKSAPAGAIVLLHACAHNPTGVDPTLEQWEQIRQLMRSQGLLPSLTVLIRDMYNEWTVELKAMADRIITMRQQLLMRISMAGLSSRTVPHLADAIHAAVTKAN
ncbi:hypothetical protein MKW92_048787, partial [Papaver armeniacum]